jgi:hypothetical protein
MFKIINVHSEMSNYSYPQSRGGLSLPYSVNNLSWGQVYHNMLMPIRINRNGLERVGDAG